MKHIAIIIAGAALSVPGIQARQYWDIDNSGGVTWTVNPGETHSDHIEMAGKKVASVLRYKVDSDGAFHINKSLVWPMLRVIPNNTGGSLMRRFNWNPLDAVTVNRLSLTNEKVKSVSIKGDLRVESCFKPGYNVNCTVKRTFFPSTEYPALIEKYVIINNGKNPLDIGIPSGGFVIRTDPAAGVKGSYRIEGKTDKSGSFTVAPSDSIVFSANISAFAEDEPIVSYDADEEYARRMELVGSLMGNLVLETPDPIINKMMDFSKIRACESIYATKGGPLHGPGGESYYAAIWANDQAEYINPYFPFIGYDYGNESALNSFRHFARFMNDDYKCIPSSIIAEGDDIWNGAGDRGDCAMIAYGAARYALARGSKKEAEELWPLISWCLEYCSRKVNAEGVVESDSDELEGRFPSGKANLCTSSLYYDALLSASCLAKELRKSGAAKYVSQAAELRKNIDRYFASPVEGFDTYAYYKGNDVLRSWICIPLTMGIDDRAEGTIQALFSPRLWTENGLLTQAGDKTFWDRSTLYALRGVYAVGAKDKATEYLRRYSSARLLGDHVPYAIEAWPEGSQRHLSAESGLYGRIVTEGLFGIRPGGLRSFSLTPRLPSEWDYMNLRHVRAFGSDFDIEVSRLGNGKIKVCLSDKGKKRTFETTEGKPITIKL